jgi:hypothetical protein
MFMTEPKAQLFNAQSLLSIVSENNVYGGIHALSQQWITETC